MKKVLKILVILQILVQTVFAQIVWDGTADTTWYTDNKSATEFTITTAEELAGLARLVRGGNDNGTYDMYLQTINLGANIMLNDTADWEDWVTNPPANEWVAIGTDENRFLGAFDGNDYVISGVYINSENDNQGLFGCISNRGSAEIKNLGVIASYIKGKSYVGGLVGTSGGTIEKSYFTGVVTGMGSSLGSRRTSYVGGLAGINNGPIEKSYSTGMVTGEGDYVGGLAGINFSGTIEKSYSTGMVTGTRDYVGGLVGENGLGGKSTISNNYSIGTVTGRDYVGGIVGRNSSRSDILYNYSVGTVTGTGYYVGGAIGSLAPSEKGYTYYNYYESQANEGYSDTGWGRIAAEMKQQETFIHWNFSEIWGIDNTINDGYPYLLDLKNTVTPIRLPQIANNKITIRATNSGIMLENLPHNAKVEVYNLHGKLIYNSQFSILDSQFIEVQTKGIYIIKVGTQIFRIAVGQK